MTEPYEVGSAVHIIKVCGKIKMTPEKIKEFEDNLWQTADTLRANSDMKSSEYATPVLGMIFLKFADNKYSRYEDEILDEYKKLKGTRREKKINEIALAKCGFYLPEHARFSYLLNLPEKKDIDKAIKDAMAAIEEYKPELSGVLPQDEYFKLTRTDRNLPKDLLKNFSNIPADATGDMFGKIYEYFLGKFALSEGQGGGEFFTPNSVVRLMVEIIEPHHGKVFDPACGSGGMFVQSGQFVRKRQHNEDTSLFVYGQEKTEETVKLAKMNLAVNGLRGEIRQANTYYEDPFQSFGQFDYVLANPPFNVDDVTLAKVEKDPRFNTYGIPRNKTKNKKKGEEACPNANYLWINLFATSLNDKGRAALVMANSASDARHSEAAIRQTLIENNLIYAMLTLPSNMFYTVTLPATLWFFDKAKQDDKILFIDARNIFTPVDRAHREFSQEQILNIGLISKLHRGDRPAFTVLVDAYFSKGMDTLMSSKSPIAELADRIKAWLKKNKANEIPDLKEQLAAIDDLEKKAATVKKNLNLADIDAANAVQKNLARAFQPFFSDLHDLLKIIDKKVRKYEKDHPDKKETRQLKEDLTRLHQEIKIAESFFIHIHWLQERFPNAAYEDVTGLCKLAGPDDIKEQDYSLNPGRYVGVVIEEDGKTEEEFIEELIVLNDELEKLNAEAKDLEEIIGHNIRQIVGEE